MRISRAIGLGLVCVAMAAVVGPARAADDAATLKDRLKAEPFKIAYESYVGDHSDIFVMNADGTNQVNLTNSTGDQYHYPQVSADGKKICYTVDAGTGRDAVRSVWVMDVDGGNRKKIADHAREPFWGSDGTFIGYLPQEYDKFDVVDYDTKGMMYYHLDTGVTEPHPNSANLRHLYHPRMAPNGKWIVATVHGGMGFSHTILAIEAHGNRIIDLKIPGCRPTISSDGQHIAWGSDDHQINTALIDTDAETPHVGQWLLHIKDEKNKLYHIAWSPDGRYVSFSRGPDGEGDLTKTGTFQAACEIIGVYATNWNLYAARADQPGDIIMDTATPADVLQLTTSGTSNKESFWFRPADAAKTKE